MIESRLSRRGLLHAGAAFAAGTTLAPMLATLGEATSSAILIDQARALYLERTSTP